MSDNDSAQVSAEFPVVVLGEASAATQPRQRLLQGRVAERWILYPIYLLVWVSGGLAARFALQTQEWAAAPVLAAWGMLFIWYWFYGVAYRYRRRVLKYFSVTVLVVLTWCLSLLTFDRGRAQIVATSLGLESRAEWASLYWAGGIVVVAAGLLALHVLVLGRGYRVKR